MKADFASADILAGNRVIFNIRGNRYRLVAQVAYNSGRVNVLWIGTHAEYDKIAW
jgi:mRNA interferase HigB